jgi:hypothetical protein
MKKTRLHRLIAAVSGVALMSSAVLVGAVTGATTAGAASPTQLVGTFQITAGSEPGAGTPTGSYFRMLVPGGTLNGSDASYITNASSSASDQTYTLLSPGTAGGLETGSFQPAPTPAFDGSGNALADSIVQPTGFFGLNFSVETQNPDAQTATTVVAPSISSTKGALSGNLQALSASWNGQYFNQGSPKPDGTFPTPTTAVTGTYNATTQAYTLTWASLIVGGPFNGFTGQWFLSGTFAAATFQITTLSLPGATRGIPYSGSNQLTAAGGPTPYKWKATGLPKGLKVGSTTGVIAGTPKAKHVSAGNYNVTVTATDAAKPKVAATASFTLALS